MMQQRVVAIPAQRESALLRDWLSLAPASLGSISVMGDQRGKQIMAPEREADLAKLEAVAGMATDDASWIKLTQDFLRLPLD